ncbi:MAG: glycoside hydrolase family 25 protein [Bacteroidia bacterium]|jgi:GH25 family lysozyme M1 (1,4-beta-N-acetylmuramidase)|nr:glycoside hydrolase family 25 protein [Bacteroidia bacterium]
MKSKTIYGIDVSHNNGTINWTDVTNNNPPRSFVFIKATEGVGYTDPMCATNANAVSSQTHMRFGYYHFASINSQDVANDARSEANWFAQTMSTMPPASLIPVLDIENNTVNLTPQQMQDWISAFISQMNANGYPKIFIYSYYSFLNTNLPAGHPFGNVPLWLAYYTSESNLKMPNGWTECVVWQYSGSGTVNGVTTQCDLNQSSTTLYSPEYDQRTYDKGKRFDPNTADLSGKLSTVRQPGQTSTEPATETTQPATTTAPAETAPPAATTTTASEPVTNTAPPPAHTSRPAVPNNHPASVADAATEAAVNKFGKKGRRGWFFGIAFGRYE